MRGSGSGETRPVCVGRSLCVFLLVTSFLPLVSRLSCCDSGSPYIAGIAEILPVACSCLTLLHPTVGFSFSLSPPSTVEGVDQLPAAVAHFTMVPPIQC